MQKFELAKLHFQFCFNLGRKKLIYINIFICNKKQIFHGFLFNIRNYLPEVSYIQRHEAELNITLQRVNKFNIKQKMARNICLIIYHQHQTKSK